MQTREQRAAGWATETNHASIAASVAAGAACAGCGQRWMAGDQRVTVNVGEMHPACAKAKGYDVTVTKRKATFSRKDLFA